MIVLPNFLVFSKKLCQLEIFTGLSKTCMWLNFCPRDSIKIKAKSKTANNLPYYYLSNASVVVWWRTLILVEKNELILI